MQVSDLLEALENELDERIAACEDWANVDGSKNVSRILAVKVDEMANTIVSVRLAIRDFENNMK